jgi:ribosomal protein S18 acetylase RimI-like enzyme
MSGPEKSFVAPDPWLAQTLGIPSFVVRAPLPPDASSIASALRRCAEHGNAFVTARCPVAEIETVALLARAGFRVVDTQITLQVQADAPVGRGVAQTRLALPEDRGAVLEIAGSCFRYSRFHQDPRIEREAANRVKRSWTENCLDGRRGDEVIVAEDEGVAAGFLAAKNDVEDGRSVGTIDLVGVADSRQRRGIGESLVLAFIARWRQRCGTMRVGTQAANAPSIRLYERCGFRFSGAAYVLHAHVRQGGIA